MYKFFVDDEQIKNGYVKIIGSDVKHISNVLRLNKNDKIIVCNKQTFKSYISEIENIIKEIVRCLIIDEIIETTEAKVEVDLFQGLPKSDKMEYIIQKTTELGVKNIFPVSFERSIVKLDNNSEIKKIDRWNKIAEASAKQSKRDIVPKVERVIKLENICQNIDKYDIILVAYENEKRTSLKIELSKLDRTKSLKIGVIIGPEGGFTENEVQKLVENGAKCVSLGSRILRTETAPIVIISDIIYEFEM